VLESSQSAGKRGRQRSKRSDEIQGEYAIGKHLINFLIDRGLIELSLEVRRGVSTKKKENYISKKPLYVVCHFDISLLPIKLNLPMVCRPMDWQPAKSNSQPTTFKDLKGGYLCTPSGSMYNQFRLITSFDLSHILILPPGLD